MRCQKSRRLCAQKSSEVRPRPLSAVLHAQESKEHKNKHRICHSLSEVAGRALAKASAHVARPSSCQPALSLTAPASALHGASASLLALLLLKADVIFLSPMALQGLLSDWCETARAVWEAEQAAARKKSAASVASTLGKDMEATADALDPMVEGDASDPDAALDPIDAMSENDFDGPDDTPAVDLGF